MLEHIIFKNIVHPLETYNIVWFSRRFRRGFSMVTQRSAFSSDIFMIFHEDEIDPIIINFSEAFGTVFHAKPLYKLNKIINNSRSVAWICCFLSNWSQYVYFNCVALWRNKSCLMFQRPQSSGLCYLCFMLMIFHIFFAGMFTCKLMILFYIK